MRECKLNNKHNDVTEHQRQKFLYRMGSTSIHGNVSVNKKILLQGLSLIKFWNLRLRKNKFFFRCTTYTMVYMLKTKVENICILFSRVFFHFYFFDWWIKLLVWIGNSSRCNLNYMGKKNFFLGGGCDFVFILTMRWWADLTWK